MKRKVGVSAGAKLPGTPLHRRWLRSDKEHHHCVCMPSVPWDFTWMELLLRAVSVPGDLCSLFGGHDESAWALAPRSQSPVALQVTPF